MVFVLFNSNTKILHKVFFFKKLIPITVFMNWPQQKKRIAHTQLVKGKRIFNFYLYYIIPKGVPFSFYYCKVYENLFISYGSYGYCIFNVEPFFLYYITILRKSFEVFPCNKIVVYVSRFLHIFRSSFSWDEYCNPFGKNCEFCFLF